MPRQDQTGFFSGPLGMFAKQAGDALDSLKGGGKSKGLTKQQQMDQNAAMGSYGRSSAPKPKAKAKAKPAMKTPMKRGTKRAKKK
jgi:hypothetical protein